MRKKKCAETRWTRRQNVLRRAGRAVIGRTSSRSSAEIASRSRPCSASLIAATKNPPARVARKVGYEASVRLAEQITASARSEGMRRTPLHGIGASLSEAARAAGGARQPASVVTPRVADWLCIVANRYRFGKMTVAVLPKAGHLPRSTPMIWPRARAANFPRTPFCDILCAAAGRCCSCRRRAGRRAWIASDHAHAHHPHPPLLERQRRAGRV